MIFMRRMRQPDIAAVRALFLGANQPCPEPENCVFSFVFEHAGCVCGAALGRVVGDTGELVAFLVAPAHRDEGVETGLILCVLDLMDRHGISRCRCAIADENARPVLRAAGFVQDSGGMTAPTRHKCPDHAGSR